MPVLQLNIRVVWLTSLESLYPSHCIRVALVSESLYPSRAPCRPARAAAPARPRIHAPCGPRARGCAGVRVCLRACVPARACACARVCLRAWGPACVCAGVRVCLRAWGPRRAAMEGRGTRTRGAMQGRTDAAGGFPLSR